MHMCIYANRSLGLWFREQTIYSQTMLAALIPQCCSSPWGLAMETRCVCACGACTLGEEPPNYEVQSLCRAPHISAHTPHREISPVWGGKGKVPRFLLPLKCTQVVLREISLYISFEKFISNFQSVVTIQSSFNPGYQ